MTGRGSRAARLVAPVLSIVGAALAWQALAAIEVLPRSASAPAAILTELRTQHDVLWSHLSRTVSVTLRGYAVAAVAAVGMALVSAAVPRLTEGLLRIAVVTYSVPLIALAPVLVVWLGTGDEVRITIAAIAGFFPIAVGCIRGFRAVDVGMDELFRQLSASRAARFRALVLPGSLPYVFAGLKISAAAAVLGAIIAEWTGAESGLGVLMTLAMFSFDPPMVWLALLSASATSIGLYLAVAVTERVVIHWDVDRDRVAGSV